MDDLPYFLAFSVFPGIGPIRFRLLYDYFGSAKAAWNAPIKDLQQVGLPPTIFEKFIAFRATFSVEEYLDLLEKKQVRIITNRDVAYPKRLREISDAPFLLYIYGTAALSVLSEYKIIAIVGTRAITGYGKEVTKHITTGLIASGFTVCSGLALGVDTIAHQTTLENNGTTIAVLGCGVDIIAPSSNAYLYRKIVDNGGLVISEMPLGHRPDKGLFPARNRIISGLSLGVVVTEGAENSGSLITARNAAEQGREVFAVPGPITSPYSKGPAKLLKNGATLVESSDDILKELQLPLDKPKKIHELSIALNSQETEVLSFLQTEPKHIDTLIHETKFPAGLVFSIITKLELHGIIYEVKNQEYSIK